MEGRLNGIMVGLSNASAVTWNSVA